MKHTAMTVRVNKLWLANALIRFDDNSKMYVFNLYGYDIVRHKDRSAALKLMIEWINNNL